VIIEIALGVVLGGLILAAIFVYGGGFVRFLREEIIPHNEEHQGVQSALTDGAAHFSRIKSRSFSCPRCNRSGTFEGITSYWQNKGKQPTLGKLESGHIVIACPKCKSELVWDSLTGKIVKQKEGFFSGFMKWIGIICIAGPILFFLLVIILGIIG
jgi:hypothetical protein